MPHTTTAPGLEGLAPDAPAPEGPAAPSRAYFAVVTHGFCAVYLQVVAVPLDRPDEFRGRLKKRVVGEFSTREEALAACMQYLREKAGRRRAYLHRELAGWPASNDAPDAATTAVLSTAGR
jgi:hypothetical protein